MAACSGAKFYDLNHHGDLQEREVGCHAQVEPPNIRCSGCQAVTTDERRKMRERLQAGVLELQSALGKIG